MTVKEIAELAGTSRGTVDRVINGRGNVSPAIRDKVLKIVEQVDYQPNHLARALINSRKHIRIGVVICSIGNPFFDDVLKGIYDREKKLSSYGVEIIIKQIKGYSAKEQIDAVDELLALGIDGLDIMPIDAVEVKEYLSGLSIPIVTFNTDIDIPKLAFVGCDYYNSGMVSGDITKLILENGGEVAVVIGSFMNAGHNERVRGFVSGIAESENIDLIDQIENQDDDNASYKMVKALLDSHSPNLIYFGAAGIDGGIKAILESGKKVRIITVDETETVRKHLNTGVISATVTQQPYVQGENSIKILFDYLANNKRPRETENYTQNQVLLKNSKHFVI